MNKLLIKILSMAMALGISFSAVFMGTGAILREEDLSADSTLPEEENGEIQDGTDTEEDLPAGPALPDTPADEPDTDAPPGEETLPEPEPQNVVYIRAKTDGLNLRSGPGTGYASVGYINKGENAKQTLVREVEEEVGLHVTDYVYNDNEYFEKTNTLMHNYAAAADSENFTLTGEVDRALWVPEAQVLDAMKPGSLARSFAERYLKKKQERRSGGSGPDPVL